VDEAVDVVFRNGIGDTTSSLNVHVLEAEVLCWVVATDQVDDNIRMPDGLLDRSNVAEIKLQEMNSTQISSDLQVSLGHLFPVWDHNSIS
jgi:hypothetical protein